MNQEEVLEVARATAAQESWPFLEPISVVFRKRWFRRGGTWTVHTHINAMNARIGLVIDDQTGAVLEKRFVSGPR
jgi:hypothetical protein